MTISTTFCGVKFQNPTVLASGILGVTGDSMAHVINEGGAGAVTTKSLNLEGRDGHPNPTMITYEGGMMNAVGLPNTGITNKIPELKKLREKVNVPIIVSIFAATLDEFKKVAELANTAEGDIIEVNISCPNVQDDMGKPFACCVGMPKDITESVKKETNKPVIIKLSPNVPSISSVCQECEAAGAEGVTLINTVGPGMAINIEAAAPILANKVGGMSGPAIRPIAVKCIYDAYKAIKIPILGLGGVTTGRDAIELMMAGASLIGIGTGVYYRGNEIFSKVCEEISEWMEKNGYTSIEEIVGKVHEKY